MTEPTDVNVVPARNAGAGAGAVNGDAPSFAPVHGLQPAALHAFRDVLARVLAPLNATPTAAHGDPASSNEDLAERADGTADAEAVRNSWHAAVTAEDARTALHANLAAEEIGAEPRSLDAEDGRAAGVALTATHGDRVAASTAPDRNTPADPHNPHATGPADVRAARATIPDPREPHGVHRSTGLLAPELRTRLDRIIERMRDEFGHEVRVVETYRSSERQAALYAQGRTTPGPTVTWTRESQHMHGRAVDVIIDNDYGNAVAYERLARIATEEGIRTLGARDPGHLELPGESLKFDAVRAPAATAVARSVSMGNAGVAQPGGVARVAQVAAVAQVAQVTRVAQVARPGAFTAMAVARPAETGATRPAITGRETLRAAGTFTAPHAESLQAGSQASAHATPQPLTAGALRTSEASSAETRASRDGQVIEPVDVEAVQQEMSPFSIPSDRARSGSPEPHAVTTTSGTDFAARVARVLALQESAQATPTSGVTLLVENAEGTAARIRVGLRGTAVGATIDMADAAAARELELRVDELRRGLERQGLDAGTLLVRAAAPTREHAETVRATAAVAAELVPSAGKPAEGQNPHDRNPGSPRRDADLTDQRQKRQGKENPS